MKYKIPTALSILLLLALNQISAQPDETFTVYCTGNHDTTGSCLKTSDSKKDEEFNCIMVPGNIIDCKSNSDTNIECILITATSAQAEFSCSRENAKSHISVETTPKPNSGYKETIIYSNEEREFDEDSDKPQSNVFQDPF